MRQGAAVLGVLAAVSLVVGAPAPRVASVRVDVAWDRPAGPLRTRPSLQVVANRLLRRGSSIHDQAFGRLRELRCSGVRYILWHPEPRLAVPEPAPPAGGRTSWDFAELDPMIADVMAAMEGRPIIVNFSVPPAWLFREADLPTRAGGPATAACHPGRGPIPRDPTLAELAGYYARIAAWYAADGFMDETGREQHSGHRYRFDGWEVLNEPNAEQRLCGEEYARWYDAIVAAVRPVTPDTRFIGPALVFPFQHERFLKTFLKLRHHQPGMPVDLLSYHLYAMTRYDRLAETCPAGAFQDIDAAMRGARRVERIRAALRPTAGTAITEAGTVASEDVQQWSPGYVFRPIPPTYWRLSAAVFAYMVSRFAELGVDVVAESALAQFPGEFPSVTMLDWETGEPNARYWVLKLLCDAVTPGGTLVAAASDSPTVHAQAWTTAAGGRRLLLVNTCDRPVALDMDGVASASWTVLDEAHPALASGPLPAASPPVLGGFGVAIVELAPR